jgi:hypothetical protein
VAHTYNPSYSGGRDQEDPDSKAAWENSSARPDLKKPFTKTGLVEWLKMKAMSLSPSTAKKKKDSVLAWGWSSLDLGSIPIPHRNKTKQQQKSLLKKYSHPSTSRDPYP